jgi:type IV secretion system protein VirB6
MAADFHFYQRAFSELNNALSGYVSDVASNIIGAITPVATTLLTIYVVLWGWTMLRGMIQEPIIDGTSRMIRLSVISGIALSLGRYNGFIADFLWQTPDALASYMVSGASGGGGGNVQFLDGLMSQMYDLGNAFWNRANATGGLIPDVGMLATALLIWAAGLVATAYAAFLLMLSKAALAILLGIGPVFVLLLIFDGTKRFFESWMGQALNYVALVILSAAAIKLILAILQKYLVDASGSGLLADPSPSQALPAIGMCLIGALVMMQLPSIAAALGGGTAISTLGAVAWSYRRAKDGVAAMRPTNVRRSFHRARADVRIAGGAARATVGAPMAVYRKITQSRGNRVTRTGT